MPATCDEPPTGRLTDHLDLGVLAACYPRDLIEDILAETGTKEQRRSSLPAHVVMRHTIAWGLDPPRAPTPPSAPWPDPCHGWARGTSRGRGPPPPPSPGAAPGGPSSPSPCCAAARAFLCPGSVPRALFCPLGG